MKRGLIIAVLIISVFSGLRAQDDKISFRFDRILFGELADTIEKVIPVKIYFSDSWVDSLYVSVNEESETLNDLLKKSLSGGGLYFFVDDEGKVILSKGYPLKGSFGREYLNHLKSKYSEISANTIQRPVEEAGDNGISEDFRLFTLGRPSMVRSDGNAELGGTVYDLRGEPVAGAVVYVEKLKAGVITNNSGYYNLTVPAGEYRIEYRMVGMRLAVRNVRIWSDGNLDVTLSENTSQLDEVIISAERENIVKNVRIGIEKIDTKVIKQIPMGLGEADIIKSSLLLPGVQTVGEASAGFNVRGGNTDQNLVLLDFAPIINSSHFFGFFSSFNSDLVSNVTLYKNGTPAKFGGRISSVMDIAPLEGQTDKVRISGGISPVTGRIMAQGPIFNEKYSFVAGARTTYSDWLLGMLGDQKLSKSSAGFYDLQGTFIAHPDEKNTFSLSAYRSNDKFDYYRENAFRYGNAAATLKWKHVFNPKNSATLMAVYSSYDYELGANQDSTRFNTTSYKLDHRIIRGDFTSTLSPGHRLEYGAQVTFYNLSPGERNPFGDFSVVTPKTLSDEKAIESSVYIGNEFEVSPKISLSAGIRGTVYNLMGPGSVYSYDPAGARSRETIIDSVSYGAGKIIKTYPGVDFRFSGRLELTRNSSIKLGFQRMFQYIHMMSNTTSMSPTDIWKLSNEYIKPQRGDQVSLGIYHNYGRKGIQTSAEGYYKLLENIPDYKGGAVLLMNNYLEADVISTRGKAYGVELMVRRESGVLNGWVSYTYSRIMLRSEGIFASEKINDNQWFPANYDKPHDFKIVANAKVSRRFNITSNLVYNTGRPVTFPVAFFDYRNAAHVYYSNRNAYRIPDYMRVDLSATMNGNLRERKLNHSSLTATIYNLLGRRNAYSIFFKTEEGEVKGYKMTIFARPVFMLTYNFRIMGNATGDF